MLTHFCLLWSSCIEIVNVCSHASHSHLTIILKDWSWSSFQYNRITKTNQAKYCQKTLSINVRFKCQKICKFIPEHHWQPLSSPGSKWVNQPICNWSHIPLRQTSIFYSGYHQWALKGFFLWLKPAFWWMSVNCYHGFLHIGLEKILSTSRVLEITCWHFSPFCNILLQDLMTLLHARITRTVNLLSVCWRKLK